MLEFRASWILARLKLPPSPHHQSPDSAAMLMDAKPAGNSGPSKLAIEPAGGTFAFTNSAKVRAISRLSRFLPLALSKYKMGFTGWALACIVLLLRQFNDFFVVCLRFSRHDSEIAAGWFQNFTNGHA